jgi:hypothetical protein
MNKRLDFFRGFSFLIMLVFSLGARPVKAQSLENGLPEDYLRPANEILSEHEPGETPNGITNDQRLKWFIENTVGPRSFVTGVVSAGLGTAMNAPHEYGRSGQGYGRRYEMRFIGVSTGNAMEVTLGAIWNEDPRYNRVPEEPFGRRVQNVIRMTFVAYRPNGNLAPAYARYIGISGGNFLTNSWRAPSEANFHGAALRTLLGFLGRMGSNTLQEFWPDVKRRILHE